MNEQTEAFWQQYLAASGKNRETRYFDAFSFDDTPQTADLLLALVLDGKKRATASAVPSFADGVLPHAGGLSILNDGSETPRCVIETRQVTVLPFCDIPWELAQLEGEDADLEGWRQGHRRFFSREGARLGYAFSEELPVAFERFEVVYAP